jgi:hypothetical protein
MNTIGQEASSSLAPTPPAVPADVMLTAPIEGQVAGQREPGDSIVTPAPEHDLPAEPERGGAEQTINIMPTPEQIAGFLAERRESNERYDAEQRAAIVRRSGRTIHPVCDLFPLLGRSDVEKLADDIKANGLIHPVVVHEGQIVDGRNRLLACIDLGVEPRYVEWRDIYFGSMSLSRWIWSVNAERRHLTIDQLTAVQVGIRAWEEQQGARQRQIAGKSADGSAGGRGKKKLQVSSPEGFPEAAGGNEVKRRKDRSGETCVRIANEIGTSEHKVRQALSVQQADPELLKQVAQGATTLRKAAKTVKAKAKPKPKPNGKQRGALDVERQIKYVMERVDAVLEKCSDEDRGTFLAELIQTLERMK